MYLSALWPPVGKVAKAVVAGPAGPELLVPRFWLSMFSAVSLFLLLAHFSLSVPLMQQYLLINRPCQGVKISSHRNIGYGSRHENT